MYVYLLKNCMFSQLMLLLVRTAYRPGQVQCLIKMQNVDTFPSCKKFFGFINFYVCVYL